MSKLHVFIITAIVIGAIAGSASTLALTGFLLQKSKEQLISEFYATEDAVHVSPHGLRGKMDKGVNDFVLVDLRSAEEYNDGHIIGAVNIPAYSDKYTPAYGEVDRIIGQFKNLAEQNPGKDIIVYCYSIPCMTGRKVGKMLSEHGIYVKHLGIGWNEWRYFWNMWNHEHEWNATNVEDYIVSGPEPGIFARNGTIAPCSIGEFGC